MGVFGRFREKVGRDFKVSLLAEQRLPCASEAHLWGCPRSLIVHARLLCRFMRWLLVISMPRPATASTRCMQRSVAATTPNLWQSSLPNRSWILFVFAWYSFSAARTKWVLQVHDFAQTIKECEKQVKQLEIATTGTNCVSVGVCSVTIFEHVTCKYRLSRCFELPQVNLADCSCSYFQGNSRHPRKAFTSCVSGRSTGHCSAHCPI